MSWAARHNSPGSKHLRIGKSGSRSRIRSKGQIANSYLQTRCALPSGGWNFLECVAWVRTPELIDFNTIPFQSNFARLSNGVVEYHVSGGFAIGVLDKKEIRSFISLLHYSPAPLLHEIGIIFAIGMVLPIILFVFITQVESTKTSGVLWVVFVEKFLKKK